MPGIKVPLFRDGPMVEQRDGMVRHARGERVRRVRQGRGAAWMMSRPKDPGVMPRLEEMWDDRSGSRWTPDLVHCRLVESTAILRRLPAVTGPRGHVSILGQLSLDPPDRLRAPPSTAEIALCEWTMDRVGELWVTDRFIAYGFALGLSSRRIERELSRASTGIAGVDALSHSQIINRYRATQETLAIDWNDKRHKVDRGSYERWVEWLKKFKIGHCRLDR